MRKLSRRLGTTFILLGVVVLVYAAAVVFWRDPVTDVYTAYQQHQLRGALRKDTQVWEQRAVHQFSEREVSSTTRPTPAQQLTVVRRLAGDYARAHRGHDGAPLGKLVIGRMGLSEIFVEGTDYWHSLTKGPGHYSNTSWPGLGHTTAIAGHRTTWSAPFRYIDTLHTGDAITLRLPYGTFSYRVTRHQIVKNDDWAIVKDVGYDQLVLSACHPLYSASHRYVIFARLQSVELPGSRRTVVVPQA